MTQEEKQLLLKDLCARLPYQPMCEFTDTEDDFCTATVALGYSLRDFIAGKILIKPYLRPMSSITEKEIQEYKGTCRYWNIKITEIYEWKAETFDWFNAHHFDYRGLIPMGLALEAPIDMYSN